MFELSTDLTCIAPLHVGSSAALDSNSGHAGHESVTLATKLPRLRNKTKSLTLISRNPTILSSRTNNMKVLIFEKNYGASATPQTIDATKSNSRLKRVGLRHQ
ncbi:hypothetical protein TNCV_3790161 [Trichonephila clavipes]|nr:hypothetical protein TNCV_3790161 [Trichonephila clavipes]